MFLQGIYTNNTKMIDMELIHEENVDNIATAQNIDPFDRVTIQATWQNILMQVLVVQ